MATDGFVMADDTKSIVEWLGFWNATLQNEKHGGHILGMATPAWSLTF